MNTKLHIAILILILACGCKKADQFDKKQSINLTQESIKNVNIFLDNEIALTTTAKKENLVLLKESLVFDKGKQENLGDKSVLIIPINQNFKTKKQVASSTIPTLVLTLDRSEKVVDGNIVLFYPKTDQKKVFQESSISNILKHETVNENGVFHFLSLTGKRMYQLEYDKGSLKSSGVVKQKTNNIINKPSFSGYSNLNSSSYIDWYLVTTLYYSDGTTEVIEEYLGTTYSACGNTQLESLCLNADAIGGSGGGTGEDCFSGALDAFQNEINGGSVASEELSSTSTDIDGITKYKTMTWKIFSGFGGWSLFSTETGIVKQLDQSNSPYSWAWVSLSHSGIQMDGTTLPGVIVTYSNGIGTPTFTPETALISPVFYAGMMLNFDVTFTLVCNCALQPFVSPVHKIYQTNSPFWNAHP